jgi:protoporphyrinogen IX oxidase
MISLMNNSYQYLKALHLFAAFAWMAGMLYLPRLYAYHAEVGAGTPQAETFKRMERGLLRIIMNPAMIVTVALGLWIAFGAHSLDYWRTAGWLHVKLLFVIIMLGLHGLLSKWRKDFEADRIPHSPRFFRIINEVPAVLLLAIVILAVVQPF